MQNQRPDIAIRVIVYKQDELFVAHCLDLDIVTEAHEENQVVHDIVSLIGAQIKFSVENDNMDHLFKPAPPKYWAMLNRTTKCTIQDIETPPSSHLPYRHAEVCFA